MLLVFSRHTLLTMHGHRNLKPATCFPALFVDRLILEDDTDRLSRNVGGTTNIGHVTSHKNEDYKSWTCFLTNSKEQNLLTNQQFIS